MDRIESFNFENNGVQFTVSVICYNECAIFGDLWKMTDDHHGGVTIANPEADRNSYKYGIPQNCTLAELSADYAKQGRENPSREAYESLQNQLTRDLSASDYGFRVSAEIDGVTLFDNENLGCSFDYSYEDDSDLLAAAQEVFKEHGIDRDAIGLAKVKAGEIVAQADKLKALAGE